MKTQDLVDALNLEYDQKCGWNTDEKFDRLVLLLEKAIEQRDQPLKWLEIDRENERRGELNAELLKIASAK